MCKEGKQNEKKQTKTFTDIHTYDKNELNELEILFMIKPKCINESIPKEKPALTVFEKKKL